MTDTLCIRSADLVSSLDYGGGDTDDLVYPLASDSPRDELPHIPGIPLTSLAATTPVSFSTRHPFPGLKTGPFHLIRELTRTATAP
jgi:hypothetical protein